MGHTEAWIYNVLIPSVITLALIFILQNSMEKESHQRQPASAISSNGK